MSCSDSWTWIWTLLSPLTFSKPRQSSSLKLPNLPLPKPCSSLSHFNIFSLAHHTVHLQLRASLLRYLLGIIIKYWCICCVPRSIFVCYNPETALRPSAHVLPCGFWDLSSAWSVDDFRLLFKTCSRSLSITLRSSFQESPISRNTAGTSAFLFQVSHSIDTSGFSFHCHHALLSRSVVSFDKPAVPLKYWCKDEMIRYRAMVAPLR